ncbi:MAG TPA: hypothetical protein VIS96_08365 [Terrimicrobiaceae bacterium]
MAEDIAEMEYQPRKCSRRYRLIIVRKNISVQKGEGVLFDEIRYFFYLGFLSDGHTRHGDDLFRGQFLVLIEGRQDHLSALGVGFTHGPAAVPEGVLREPLRIAALFGALRPGMPVAVEMTPDTPAMRQRRRNSGARAQQIEQFFRCGLDEETLAQRVEFLGIHRSLAASASGINAMRAHFRHDIGPCLL